MINGITFKVNERLYGNHSGEAAVNTSEVSGQRKMTVIHRAAIKPPTNKAPRVHSTLSMVGGLMGNATEKTGKDSGVTKEGP